jgi:hypothetical protein
MQNAPSHPAQIDSPVVRLVEVLSGLFVKGLFKVMELVFVVKVFDGLLQAYGDEKTDADGAYMDEQDLPGGAWGGWRRSFSSFHNFDKS